MASSEQVLVIELSKTRENQKLLDPAPTGLAGAGQGAGATQPVGVGQTYGMRCGRVYLQPGQACGEHSTKDREEVLVFLSGWGELLIAGQERFNVGEGKISYIPPQTPHNVRNTGDGPLVYVYCVTPVASYKGK